VKKRQPHRMLRIDDDHIIFDDFRNVKLEDPDLIFAILLSEKFKGNLKSHHRKQESSHTLRFQGRTFRYLKVSIPS